MSKPHRGRRVRFALPPYAAPREAAAFRLALLHASSLRVEIVQASSYAALFEAVDSGACEAAWAPPLVALDLARCGSAAPTLALVRGAATTYHAVLVTRADGAVRGLADLAGCRMGWVAPESASGHVIPRQHLAALGLELDGWFGQEVFLGSHARALDALEAGLVDVVATYGHRAADGSARVVGPRIGVPTRVIAASGPIPADVVVIGERLAGATRDALTRGLLGLSDLERTSLIPLVHARGFVRIDTGHLDPLRALSARAAERALAPFAAWRPPSVRPSALAYAQT